MLLFGRLAALTSGSAREGCSDPHEISGGQGVPAVESPGSGDGAVVLAAADVEAGNGEAAVELLELGNSPPEDVADADAAEAKLKQAIERVESAEAMVAGQEEVRVFCVNVWGTKEGWAVVDSVVIHHY